MGVFVFNLFKKINNWFLQLQSIFDKMSMITIIALFCLTCAASELYWAFFDPFFVNKLSLRAYYISKNYVTAFVFISFAWLLLRKIVYTVATIIFASIKESKNNHKDNKR